MARSAETVVYVLDLSLGISEVDFKDSILFVEQQLTAKLLYNPKDEVACITFGTSVTNNELHLELGGYDGIDVCVPWQQVSASALEAVHGTLATSGERTVSADFVSAVVVAMDLLVKAKGVLRKGGKRIVLLTSPALQLDQENPEDSTEEQVDQLSSQLMSQGIQLEVILLPPGGSHSSAAVYTREDNIALLGRFLGLRPGSGSLSEAGHSGYDGKGGGKGGIAHDIGAVGGMAVENELGVMRQLASCSELLFRGQHRVQPSTAYRGDLEVTPGLRIKVWAYKKTMRQRLPSLKTYSEEAPEADPGASHAVKVEREFRLADETETVVPFSELVKAYKYGPQVIPISDMDKEAMLFKAEKGIKLLGFTTRDRVPRHYYMKEASLLLPPPGEPLAATALSALARAMANSERVAIARCKLTERKDAGVTLAVLTPALTSDPEAQPDALWCNTVPFAEDLREFVFHPLEKHPDRLQPGQAELDAAEVLVATLDLGPQLAKGDPVAGAGGTYERPKGALLPETTPNRSLQEYHDLVRCHLLKKNAKDPATLEAVTIPTYEEQLPWVKASVLSGTGNQRISSAILKFTETEDKNRGPIPPV